MSPGEREPLIGKLLDLYRNDPDSGIHGAAEWTLRQWGQQEKLKEMDAELMKVKDRGEHRWYVNGQGQTFARRSTARSSSKWARRRMSQVVHWMMRRFTARPFPAGSSSLPRR